MDCATRSIRGRLFDVWSSETDDHSLTTSFSDSSPFVWKDFSRFVEVAPVALGWLVLWGRYREMGRVRELAGSRTYISLSGVRRRVGDSVLELTRNPALAGEAMALFDRTRFPEHTPRDLPEAL
jgi:hypothetical protein